MKKEKLISIFETVGKILAFIIMVGIMAIMIIVASFLFDSAVW